MRVNYPLIVVYTMFLVSESSSKYRDLAHSCSLFVGEGLG
jgi:hypothetical protein